MKKFFLLITVISTTIIHSQEIAVMHYKGGGDWYSNPTALENLISFCNNNINTALNPKPATVTPDSPELFNYPYIYLTGHGNVYFSDEDAKNLRNYLISGGFLHVDDNYGLDPYFRKAIKKIFPDKILEPLPADHPIFNEVYEFQQGLPKIHVHDGKPPQLFALTHEERIIMVYSYESDLGNGWEDPEVHNDPEEVRQKALKMGANIIKYAFTR
jgi:hypothetical protein